MRPGSDGCIAVERIVPSPERESPASFLGQPPFLTGSALQLGFTDADLLRRKSLGHRRLIKLVHGAREAAPYVNVLWGNVVHLQYDFAFSRHPISDRVKRPTLKSLLKTWCFQQFREVHQDLIGRWDMLKDDACGIRLNAVEVSLGYRRFRSPRRNGFGEPSSVQKIKERQRDLPRIVIRIFWEIHSAVARNGALLQFRLDVPQFGTQPFGAPQAECWIMIQPGLKRLQQRKRVWLHRIYAINLAPKKDSRPDRYKRLAEDLVYAVAPEMN